MTSTLRKGLVLLVVLFIGFYLFTDPHGLATVARDGGGKVWEALTKLFGSVITFLNALTH